MARPDLATCADYTVHGISGRAAAGIQATAWSITRDLQTFWGSRKSYIFNPVPSAMRRCQI